MPHGYGQYCPLSLAAEVLAERWTILVISRLLLGCTGFNAIQRALPRISPSLLSKRLVELERAGIVEKSTAPGERRPTYALTTAATDLAPLIDQMAVLGQQWSRDLAHEDLDPAFLAWSMHTRKDTDALPPERVVIEFDFENVPGDLRRFWIVCEQRTVDMCLQHPGFDSDLRVRSDLLRFVEAWRGIRDLRAEIRAGRIRVSGPAALRKRFPDWLLPNDLARYPRRHPGRERTLERKRRHVR